MKITSNRVEYREKFQVSGLKTAAVGEEIILPFSTLRAWSARFEKRKDVELLAGVQMTREDDISHAVIRKVQYTVRSGSVDYKSGDREFPHERKQHSGLLSGWDYALDISPDQDCLDIEVGLIFETQLKPVNEYLNSHPDTIGQLSDKDIEELKDFRQTELKFYLDENEKEVMHSAMVDLHAMAQLSHYIRGLLRFQSEQDNHPNYVPLTSAKLISEHFTLEIIEDLIEITHGRQFKRTFFMSKSLDYMIRMGYIGNQLQIESLQNMIDDCIFSRAKWDQMKRYKFESLTKSFKYALEATRVSLTSRLWKLVFHLKLMTATGEYQKIRKIVQDAGGKIMVALADATADLVADTQVASGSKS